MHRSTLILLLLVVAVGAYIATIDRRAETTERRQEQARRALRLDPGQVDYLRVATPSIEVECVRTNNQWELVSPIRGRADASAVHRVLDHLQMLDRAEIITGREQRERGLTLEDYGLAQPRARITYRENNHESTLLVGRDAPLGGNLFTKLDASRNIIVTSTNLLDGLPRSLDELRERRLFLGIPADVSRIELRRRAGLLQASRNGQGAWRVQQPFSGPASFPAVQEFVESLFAARALDFIADSAAASSLYGLEDPTAVISLTGDRAYGEQTVRIGLPVNGQPDRVYATVQGTEAIVTVGTQLLDALQLSADDLRDRRLLPISAFDIGQIRIEENERSIRLAREGDGPWRMTEPRGLPAFDERIRAALSEWTGLRIEEFIDQPGANLAAWGLDPPSRRYIFSRGGSATPDESVGVSIARNSESNGTLLVKLDREDTLFRVSADGVRALPMDTLFYRDPSVLAIATGDVRSISMSVGGRDLHVERAGPTNGFRAVGSGLVARPDAIRAVLAAAADLRAAEFVAEDPDDLQPWGLSPPRALVTFGLTGQESIGKTLLFGEDRDESSVFATVRGGGAVFVLPASVRDLLLTPVAEPREPAPVTPAPPAEADASSGI